MIPQFHLGDVLTTSSDNKGNIIFVKLDSSTANNTQPINNNIKPINNRKSPNEYVLYVLLKESQLSAGRYLAYTTTDVIKHIRLLDTDIHSKWIKNQNIVYLYVNNYHTIKECIKKCAINKIPFRQIFIPHRQPKPKAQSTLGLILGPGKRKDLYDITHKFKLY